MGTPSPILSEEAADHTAPPAQHACTDDVLDSILARILQSVDGSDAGGSLRWLFLAEPVRRALKQLDRRKKLEMLFTLDALWQDLLTASPQEVQALADCGFLRMLCLNLHDSNPVAFARVVEGLSHCIRILPELVLKAWEYGAVRPIAAFILDHKALADTQTLILDLRLQHALYFLASMGGPLTSSGCSEEAQKTSKKCFNWFLKQGVISRVAEIWVALSKAGVELDRDGNYIVVVYRAAVTLMFASHFALVAKGPTLRLGQAGLVGATLRFLQTDCDAPVGPGFNDYRRLIVGVCTCLLLSNWLHLSTGPEPEVLMRGKKEIAEHPDILTVLQILRRLVESPDPLIARNGKLSFVALARLLTCEHPRPLPDGSIEKAFRFLGEPSIKQGGGHWMAVMAQNFCAGNVSADFLLAHFFPGFLHAFAAEAHRRKPARVYDPELEFLVGMVLFLHECLWFAQSPGKPVRKDKPDNEQVALPAKLLPRLFDLMLDTGAVAAVASLTGSACFRSANMVCSNLGSVAARKSQSDLRRFNEQMIPALVVVILEGSQDDKLIRLSRMSVLAYCTSVLAPGLPTFRLGIAQNNPSKELFVSYDWGNNAAKIAGANTPETKRGLQQMILDLQPRHLSLEVLDVIKDELQRLALYYKHRQVSFTGNPPGDTAQEMLAAQYPGERCSVCQVLLGSVKPRCSRCRAKNYCSVACQKKDWPEHKIVCEKSA